MHRQYTLQVETARRSYTPSKGIASSFPPSEDVTVLSNRQKMLQVDAHCHNMLKGIPSVHVTSSSTPSEITNMPPSKKDITSSFTPSEDVTLK